MCVVIDFNPSFPAITVDAAVAIEEPDAEADGVSEVEARGGGLVEEDEEEEDQEEEEEDNKEVFFSGG